MTDTPAGDEYGLLVGLFAVQLQLVTQDQFAAAAAEWAAGGGEESFPAALVRRGSLTAEDLALLRPLVDKHVSRHGGVEGSVAALGETGETPLRLMEGVEGPKADRTRLLLRSPAPDRSAGRTRDRAKDDTRPGGGGPGGATAPDGGPRFDVVRSHAKGGLGEVFVARDRELNREVALKEIQPRYAHDEGSRTRFFLEAEVTGGLEHPGIVPVYGLGTYEDGRPFYAMRFVRGDTLQKAIESFHAGRSGDASDFATVEFHKLVGRVVDVCYAVEYAHSRGILHRDLKPGNVMLGNHGETLVVDWGLVKTIDRDDADKSEANEQTLHPISGNESYQTVMGQAVGTPMYMSPEAAAGKLDDLGKASDVYSLGATLYAVLANRPPFASGDDIVDRVKEGRFPPPRLAVPDVPKPLEAVCLKAMKRSPSARYATARGLAEDLERWMADEPVSAYTDTLPTRLRRTVKRHQAKFAALAAAVLLSVIGLTAFSAVLSGKNAELSQSLAREEASREEAEANADVAVEMAVRAALDADNLLANAGGKDAERERQMRVAYDLFAKLPADKRAAAAFQESVVARRLAGIKRFRGEFAEAERLFEESVRLQESVGDKTPSQLTHMASTLRDLAILRTRQGDLAAAETSLERGEALLSDDRLRDAGMRRMRGLLATTHEQIAGERMDYEASVPLARTAMTAFRDLAASEDGISTDYTYDMMNAASLAKGLFALGRYEEASEVFEAARGRADGYFNRAPVRNVRLFYVALLLNRCDDLCRLSPIPADAGPLAERSEELCRYLFEEFDGQYGETLYRAVRLRALIRLDGGDADAAAETLAPALDYFTDLAEGGEDAWHWDEYAQTLEAAARIAAARGDVAEAEAFRGRAAEAAAEAVRLAPQNRVYGDRLERLRRSAAETR